MENKKIVHSILGTGTVLKDMGDLIQVEFEGDVDNFKRKLDSFNRGINPCLVHRKSLTECNEYKAESELSLSEAYKAFMKHVKKINNAANKNNIAKNWNCTDEIIFKSVKIHPKEIKSFYQYKKKFGTDDK